MDFIKGNERINNKKIEDDSVMALYTDETVYEEHKYFK